MNRLIFLICLLGASVGFGADQNEENQIDQSKSVDIEELLSNDNQEIESDLSLMRNPAKWCIKNPLKCGIAFVALAVVTSVGYNHLASSSNSDDTTGAFMDFDSDGINSAFLNEEAKEYENFRSNYAEVQAAKGRAYELNDGEDANLDFLRNYGVNNPRIGSMNRLFDGNRRIRHIESTPEGLCISTKSGGQIVNHFFTQQK